MFLTPLRPPSWLAGLILLAALPAVLAPPARADQSPALYAQYGIARSNTKTGTLGVSLPWRGWQYALWGGQVRGHWDVWTAHWHAPIRGGKNVNTWVIGAVPVLRWQGMPGQSPWFAQVGLGMSLALNRRHATGRKQLPTRYNFATHIGGGYAFGAQQRHELMLLIEHHSNGNTKMPNPGEDFLQIRYVRRF